MDDLIAVPKYGWLYRMHLECGDHVLTQEPQRFYFCPVCGTPLALFGNWETLRGPDG